jgi:hypothetical protein
MARQVWKLEKNNNPKNPACLAEALAKAGS